jgi:ribosome biogenesis protein Nip4
MGMMQNTYKVLVGKLDGERPLRRPRSKWEDNITMVLRETGWVDMDWNHVLQDREQWWAFVNMVNLRLHKMLGNV